MTRVQKLVTEDSFDARGVLVPAGHIGEFDTDRLNGDEKHLHDVGDFQPAVVEMAAIGPTGPNPTVPQQVPFDAVQGPGGEYLTPGKVLRGEVTNPQETRIDDAGLRDLDAEGKVDDKLGEIMGSTAGTTAGNADDALVAGTVAEVTAGLGGKTDDELNTLLAAENDREKPRVGVTSAIEDELASRKAIS